MQALLYLIPCALLLGLLGLVAFLWALRDGQFEDLDGAAARILRDDNEAGPASVSLATATPDKGLVADCSGKPVGVP